MQNENLKLDTGIDSMLLSEQQKAQISDLADDQLRGSAFADAMALLQNSSQARAIWYRLHVVGDALRSDVESRVADSTNDLAFLDQFRANLAKEPVLMPLGHINSPSNSQAVAAKVTVANDSFFNWKWFGGLSAAAAVAAFSWNVISTTPNESIGLGAKMAQTTVAPPLVEAQTAAGVLIRNPQLDALIAAHQQIGGSSALQMPSGFMRSATFAPSTEFSVGTNK